MARIESRRRGISLCLSLAGRRRCVAVCLVLLAIYGTRGSSLPAWARFCNVGETPRRADHVLCLGGDWEIRPFVTADLYHAGLARNVFITQPPADVAAREGLRPPEHEQTLTLLLGLGIPRERLVVFPEEAASTHAEAVLLQRFLADRPGETVTVVTNGYHTRRARLIFRRVHGTDSQRLQFVGAPTDGFDETDWWQSDVGTQTYALEFLKLLYTLFGPGH